MGRIPCLLVAVAALALPVPAQESYAPNLEPASDEGARTMATLELAEGLEVDLFAAEPMLANPVCLYVDDDGTVYVGETFRHHAGVTDIREHMGWLDDDLASRTVSDRLAMFAKHEGEDYDAYATEHERVRQIVDEDGDGSADRSTVFADGFNSHAAGIGAGLLSRKGDVYYTCIPDLWRLNDRDGDGVAEERERLHTGFGVNVALLGHDLHGLRIGPDGLLYFSIGDRGFNVQTDTGVLAHSHTGAVLRCELDGSALEVYHTGLRNPQELVFDDYGNLWTGDNNSDGGDKARWVNVVEGGESGWRYSYQWITEPVMRGPWNDEKLWHPRWDGQAAYIVPPIANLAAGPSGLTYYPGTGLSPEYAGHFFLCDFRGDRRLSGVHVFDVKPKGAFWELGEVERFVWKTLVTDIDFGPDGRLYFTDWVEGWNKTGKGRVYRVFDPVHADSAVVAETRDILAAGMEELDLAELRELVSHADKRVRQEAQFELVVRGTSGVEALLNIANDASLGTIPRLHGIWGIGMAARASYPALPLLFGLVSDRDAEVRAQTVRVLGDLRDGRARRRIVAALSDSSARVQFFAAIASGRLAITSAVGPLRAILARTGASDPNLRHACVMGLFGCASAEDLDRLSADESSDVRMGALLVYRRLGDANIARFLDDPDPLLVLEAVRAIHDAPIEGAMPQVAALHARLDVDGAGTREPALLRRVLNANYRVGGAAGAQALTGVALDASFSTDQRVEALQMLTDWMDPAPRDRVLNAWRPIEARGDPGLAELVALMAEEGIADAPESVVRAWLDLVVVARGTLGPDVGARFESLGERIAVWCSDTARAKPVRLRAFEALEKIGHPRFPEMIDVALTDRDGELRALGLAALDRLSPADALPRIPPVLKLGELEERRTAYRLLGELEHDDAARLLTAELERLSVGLVPAELRLDLVFAVEARADPELSALLEARSAPRAAADPELAPYLDGLFGGDRRAGKRAFQRIDLSCVRCHDAGDDQVGPALKGVAKRLTRMQMLESTIQPNRRTTPGYQGTALFLTDGKVVAGRIVEEGEEALKIQDSDGAILTVRFDEIDERRVDLSAMPEDLGKTITRIEMRDLLEYLSTL